MSIKRIKESERKFNRVGHFELVLPKTIFNPLVPRVQKIKIRDLTLRRLLVVDVVKKMVYLGAHYSERQGLMG